jgi:hypothetical protein
MFLARREKSLVWRWQMAVATDHRRPPRKICSGRKKKAKLDRKLRKNAYDNPNYSGKPA